MRQMPNLARCLLLLLIVASVAAGAGTASGGSQRFFFTPGPNGASCELDVAMPGLPTAASCQIAPPHVAAGRAASATLKANGTVTLCHGIACIGNPPENARRLAYGHT